MSSESRAMSSVYLEWAKLQSVAPYNLATSGIAGYPLSALPVTVQDLEINGPDSYGHKPLLARFAAKCNVTPDHVVTTNGTSMANHLAMAAILSPGDDVLVEFPAYGLLLEVASYLGAKIHRFNRLPENQYRIDLEEVRGKLTAKTRLIVLTNLHNPSGALVDRETLLGLGELAAEVGARVLVDEVYLPMLPEFDFALPSSSAVHLGSQFVVTSSLTKAFGLSGIRAGWILAEPALAKRIWRLNDLFNATPVHPGELLACVALDNLEKIGDRARTLLATNWPVLKAFLAGRSDLEVVMPPGGTVVFPRLLRDSGNGSVREFCQMLRSDYQTAVVPGEFFEMPDHFRIGIGGEPEMTAKALGRLGTALDDYADRIGR